MSINNFIPTVWAAEVLINLFKAEVYTQAGVVNRDYEGDIKNAGDTVRINAIGPITIGTYTKNTNIGDPQTLADAATTLTIDQSKYFNFAIDDVDRAQQQPKVMSAAMQQAAYNMADTIDQFVAGIVVNAGNLIGSDAAPKTDLAVSSGLSPAYDYLVKLGVLLDTSNVPSAGRWAIVPPFFHGLLQRDDRFVRYGTPAQDEVLKNGVIGAAAGFTVLKSNNVPLTGAGSNVYNVAAGHEMAISFAEQIVSVEAYRPPQRFGDAVKGLHVYGAKLVRPQALAVLKCQDPGS